MKVFFDTSALVKFFNVEQGTDRVTQLILNRRNQIFISELLFVCSDDILGKVVNDLGYKFINPIH